MLDENFVNGFEKIAKKKPRLDSKGKPETVWSAPKNKPSAQAMRKFKAKRTSIGNQISNSVRAQVIDPIKKHKGKIGAGLALAAGAYGLKKYMDKED